MAKASRWLVGLAVILAVGAWLSSRPLAEDGDSGPLSPRRSGAPAHVGSAAEVQAPDSATSAPRSRAGPPVLAVRVLDHRGNPASGVRVVVAANRERAQQSREWVETRAPGGAVTIPLEDLRELVPASQEEVFIGLVLPCRVAPGTTTRITPDSIQPVELRLPPTGGIVVRLAPGDVGTVRLIPSREGRAELPPLGRKSQRVPIREGQAIFPHVGLGLEFEVSASLEGTTGRVEGHVSGPVEQGQQVVLDLVHGMAASVTGHLFRGLGPVAGGKFRIRASWGREVREGIVHTDGEGRFRWMLPEEVSRRSSVVIELSVFTSRAPTSGAFVEADLPGIRSGLERDLGDLVLQDPPVLLAGTVVDSVGTPVRDAVVEVDVLQPGLGGDGSEVWTEMFHLRAQSDESGRFELSSRGGRSAMRARARKGGHVKMLPLRFQPGDLGRRLVLSRPGGLVASWVHADYSLARALSPRLVDAEGEAWSGKRAASGTQTLWTSLRPGFHDFTLEVGRWPILAVQGLLVRPGEVLHDPRLQEIDVTQLLDICRITVTDEADLPIRRSSVHAHGPTYLGGVNPDRESIRNRIDATAGVLHCSQDADGAWLVLTLRGVVGDVLVSASGYRSKIVEQVTGELQVRLQRALGLTLVATGSAPLVTEQGALQVVLEPVGSVDGRRYPFARGTPRSSFDAQRRATVELPGPGRYTVVWLVPSGPVGSERDWTASYAAYMDLGNMVLYARVDGGVLQISEEDAGGILDIAPPSGIWE